ncbi:MAG TPA: allophanate hydrolase [Pseudomonadales bacterium]|nr:allophanate hydrolase [Pseudomonadales bacterium]
MKLTVSALQAGYANGSLNADELIRSLHQTIKSLPDQSIWISIISDQQLDDYLTQLAALDKSLPLWGIPFAIKDNIDLAGLPTTCACPDFAYFPEKSAFVVEALIAAGAIPLGKTNLDQFATGLVGTRSPYGIPSSIFSAKLISGGSSSGSAVAVALNQVSFALGTDTAGSGRVPAAFNGLVGLKPSRGILSTEGVFPACKTLDCVSIFAQNTSDAAQIFQVAAKYNAHDNSARPFKSPKHFRQQPLRAGILKQEQRTFFGDQNYAHAYDSLIQKMQRIGLELIEIDYTPFAMAAAALYGGGWLAERFVAIESLLKNSPTAIHEVVRNIIANAEQISAADTFKGIYAMQEYQQRAQDIFTHIDFLLLPTAPSHFSIESVLQDPYETNKKLGTYTNFVNLLDLSALALPGGFTEQRLPFGYTLIAPAQHDYFLLETGHYLSQQLQFNEEPAAIQTLDKSMDNSIKVTVVGAHLSGMPLNYQLTERHAYLVEKTKTAGNYRLFALPNTTPPKPGLLFDPNFSGDGIDVEVWEMPMQHFGSFVELIPAPLGIGSVQLASGEWVKGFICEGYAVADAKEVTALGGWRNYIKSRQS